MIGVVFKLFYAMVKDRFGDNTLNLITESTGCPSKKKLVSSIVFGLYLYIFVARFDDFYHYSPQLLQQYVFFFCFFAKPFDSLMKELARITMVSTQGILEMIGESLVQHWWMVDPATAHVN